MPCLVHPPAVAQTVFRNLLQEVLPGHVELLFGRAVLRHILETCYHLVGQPFGHLRVHLPDDLEHEFFIRLDIDIAKHADTVCAAFLFPDRLGVEDIEAIVEITHGHVQLRAVRHVIVPQHDGGSHRGLHFHFVILFGRTRNLIEIPVHYLERLLLCRQRAYVLLDERLDCLKIDISEDIQTSIPEVAEYLAVVLLHYREISARYEFRADHVDTRVVPVNDLLGFLVEFVHRLIYRIGDYGHVPADSSVVLFLVETRIRSIKVHQLQCRFEILLCRVSGNHACTVVQRHPHRSVLAGKHLPQV